MIGYLLTLLVGRKWAFNITLGLTAIWGLIAASAPNFAAIAIFDALWSFGVGGNLPVDSAIFLEFLPASHQYLLTVLSIDWAIAQVIGTLIAWPLLGNYTCEQDATTCRRSDNMGWRYFTITVGGLTLCSLAHIGCSTLHVAAVPVLRNRSTHPRYRTCGLLR